MANRESRRKRILERGSDRLAFIAGRGPPPSQQVELRPATDSSKPLIFDEPCISSDQTTVTPPIGNHKEEGESFGSTLLTQDPDIDTSKTGDFLNNGTSSKSLLTDCKTGVDALNAPAAAVNGQEQSSLISSTDQNSFVSTSSREQQHLEPHRGQHKFLTPSQISSAISATGRTRLFCSVAIALLVIFSYLEFPLCSSIRSILNFRPLFLVLLTNVTVVLSRLLFNTRGGLRIRGGNSVPSSDGWAQVSIALEVGLMIQKVIDAIFMDCSVYSIVVICGLAFT